MAFDAAPVLNNTLLERQIADIDKVIAFLGDERNWVQGAPVRGYRMCADQTLTELEVRHLEDHMLYAAQEITGYAYDSIPAFNDAAATTHDVLMSVLRQVRRNIEAGVYPVCPAPCSVPPPPEGAVAQIKAVFEKPTWLGQMFGTVGDIFRLLGHAFNERFEGPFAKNY